MQDINTTSNPLLTKEGAKEEVKTQLLIYRGYFH
jgi:hypothetical protein